MNRSRLALRFLFFSAAVLPLACLVLARTSLSVPLALVLVGLSLAGFIGLGFVETSLGVWSIRDLLPARGDICSVPADLVEPEPEGWYAALAILGQVLATFAGAVVIGAPAFILSIIFSPLGFTYGHTFSRRLAAKVPYIFACGGFFLVAAREQPVWVDLSAHQHWSNAQSTLAVSAILITFYGVYALALRGTARARRNQGATHV